MTKAKSQSLLERVRGLVPAVPRAPSWWDILRDRDPETYAEIVEVVNDFIRGGDARDVFKHASLLARYLRGEDPQRPGENLLGNVKDPSFRRFIQFLKANPDG